MGHASKGFPLLNGPLIGLRIQIMNHTAELTAQQRAAEPRAITTPLLYSRKEAARLLSISLRSVDYMIAGGKLRTRKIGSRILIPASAVHRMAETGCAYGVTDGAAA